MGEPRTVNKGFQMAKGEYLIVVNSDDPVMPGFVSTAVAFMEAHPDVLAAYPRWLWIDENGEVIQEFPTYEFDYQTMLLAHHCYPGPGAIIRRRAIELEHGRDVTFRWLSDYDFWLRVGLHGPIARIPAVLALSRKHWRARTYADVSPALVQEHIRTVENFYERPDLPPEIVALKNQAISYTYYVAGAVMMPLDWSTARQYFIHSLRISLVCRVRHPNGDTRSWMLMLRVILLPRAVNKFLKQLWLPLKKILRPSQPQ
jgi:hypothetical protein